MLLNDVSCWPFTDILVTGSDVRFLGEPDMELGGLIINRASQVIERNGQMDSWHNCRPRPAVAFEPSLRP
jgi:hypothetical protein